MKPLRVFLPTAAAFAGGILLGGMRAEATPESQNPYASVSQLGRVLVQVENNYVDPVERDKMVEGAIKGMVENLDPHSAYLPPEDWRQFQSDTEGRFGGVGLEVDGRSDKLIVIAPIEGSPAERAGIKSGDQIVAIDGDDVVGQAFEKIVKRMRGGPGSKVKITMLREKKDRDAAGAKDGGAPTGSTLTFELTREIIHVAAVSQKLLDGSVGYFRIKQFQERTHAELVAGIAKLRAEGKGEIAGVLLDVRSNPGGLVDEATEIADEFLTTGGIYSMRHRGRIIEDLKARGGGALADVPVVVLVNEYSASASELLVGALQDNHRATVVGTNTFGKGSVQSVLPLPNGAGLKLTTARYYTPSGHAIQADGIHPDVTIDPPQKPGSEESRILRERDLPGHLTAEGPRPASEGSPLAGRGPMTEGGRRDADAGAHVAASAKEEVLIGAAAREIPADPSSTNDTALRVGYRMLRTQMAQQVRR